LMAGGSLTGESEREPADEGLDAHVVTP
jgi:hypothetical protein